jgi:Domain of unknown function (DUF6484)
MKRSKPVRQLAAVTALTPHFDPASTARIGTVVGVSPEGQPLVDYPGNRAGPLSAVSTVASARADLEAAAERRQAVVLLFDGGDPRSPIVIGFVVPSAPAAEPRALAEGELSAGLPEVAEIDGKRVGIEGKDEIVLRCGEASITLRRNGKVVLRGTYLESHSKGTNRIKGGSVQIN